MRNQAWLADTQVKVKKTSLGGKLRGFFFFFKRSWNQVCGWLWLSGAHLQQRRKGRWLRKGMKTQHRHRRGKYERKPTRIVNNRAEPVSCQSNGVGGGVGAGAVVEQASLLPGTGHFLSPYIGSVYPCIRLSSKLSYSLYTLRPDIFPVDW